MKRIFTSPVLALAAGLCLRLFLVLKFPAASGDTALYEQIATNWLKQHAYALDLGGALTPVDVRMPGYPAFLALIYALTGRSGEAARLRVMLVQTVMDLLSCLVIAMLAGHLLQCVAKRGSGKRVFIVSLWLAALCPFTANYTAVVLTETITIFWTTVALLFFVALTSNSHHSVFPETRRAWDPTGPRTSAFLALSSGLAVGLGTLFRPETPLLLVAAWAGNAFLLLPRGKAKHLLRIIFFTALGCLLPLASWAIRNALTFNEVQFLTPKYSTLPGEIVPHGFMAWEETWLYRVSDCYLVPWKLNEEPINVDEIPTRAFDSSQEKQRVAAILEKYNNDLSLSQEEDAAFGQVAQERAVRHPLRTYLWIPAARAITMWFSPRIELLPISGNVFPLARMHDEDPADQGFTILFFLLNIIYVGLGFWGAIKLWRSSPAVRPALVFLILFIVLRTAFLTTLETPEPRYVLVCFPALIAFGAQLFAEKPEPALSN